MLSKISIEVFAKTGDEAEIIYFFGELCTDSKILNLDVQGVGRLELTQLQTGAEGSIKKLALKAQLVKMPSTSVNLLRNACEKIAGDAPCAKEDIAESRVCLHDAAVECKYAGSRKVEDIKGYASISGRELEVLQALAKGLRNKQVAEKLKLSEKTISTYKTRIFRKLGMSTNIELSDLARKVGII